ncbi:MAG: YjbQ family protein [Candidatus Omnitrophota bacterium]|nr:MAG: YjbQ family protein [Candidatus Omnitrophota bacterium]
MVVSRQIQINTKGHTEIIDITPLIEKELCATGLHKGIVTIFVSGSTAGVSTIEYEPGLLKDIKALFERIAPVKGEYAHNLRWGDGNGYAHIRACLLKPDLTIPFSEGRLTLGRWQQVIFVDFDNRPRQRKIILQFMGE